jgi:hypothetical protein
MDSGDVTAVVLTLGEATTERAIASLRTQTMPPAEVVMVEGVRPPHAALNRGASQVQTPFFVEVDADMVLDPTCFETLRSAVRPDVGIVVGQLRDPLVAGAVTGIKLFRTRCLDDARWRDSVIQDIDFYRRLVQKGWATAQVLVPDRRPDHRHTLGEHRPDYTVDYTYSTYHQLGTRWRYYRDLHMLTRRIGLLRRSAHPLAPVARLALGHGTFTLEERDIPKRPPGHEERAILDAVAASPADPASLDAATLLELEPEDALDRFRVLGCTLRAAADHHNVAAWLRALARTPAEDSALAEVGLCGGVLGDSSAESARELLDDMRRGLRDTRAEG